MIWPTGGTKTLNVGKTSFMRPVIAKWSMQYCTSVWPLATSVPTNWRGRRERLESYNFCLAT